MKMRLLPLLFHLTLFPSIFYFGSSCSTSLINRVCNNSSRTDPNFTYAFCKTSLQAAPASRCANVRGLGMISIKLVRNNATDTRCCIRGLLGKKGLDPYVRACLEDCLGLYSDGVDSLTQAIKDFRSGDYFGANIQVSSVLDAAATCEDGFEEKNGVVSPLTKQNNNTFRLGAVSLSIIDMQA